MSKFQNVPAANVPAHCVEWKARHTDGREIRGIMAMRWYDAREEAVRQLGCERAEVHVWQA